MRETQKGIDNVRLLVYVLALVVIALAFLGAPAWLSSDVVGLFTSLITGALIGLVATAFVESLTGDALKVVLLEVEVLGFRFSITIFLIATALVRLWLFH